MNIWTKWSESVSYTHLLNKQETYKERNIIYQIGYENGYNKNTINKIENKIKYKIKTEQLIINQNEQHINNKYNIYKTYLIFSDIFTILSTVVEDELLYWY